MDASPQLMSATVEALLGFVLWFLVLTGWIGLYRSTLILGGRPADQFRADSTDVSAFGLRLGRARDNVFENLPAVAALALLAIATGRTAVTDPLAMPLLYARLAQSVTHLASTSVPAIFIRFGCYLVQIVILVTWVIQLAAS